jgi:hypothetical protein
MALHLEALRDGRGRLGRAAEAFHAKRPQLGLVPVDIALRLLDGLPRPLSAFPRP